MSWDQIWVLPGRTHRREAVEAAVRKAVAEFEGTSLVTAGWADDVADEATDAEGYAFELLVPQRWLDDAGDEPEHEADDGLYQGVIRVAPDDTGGEWMVSVASDEADNHDANLAVSTIAARISVFLGGPEEPEPI